MTFPLRGYTERKSLPYADEELCIVAYCAEEVRRQGDTPWHVFRMYRAWKAAQGWYDDNRRLTHQHVRMLGHIIDEENVNGYRASPIWIGGELKPYHDIHVNMSRLLDRQQDLSPEQFYLEFETIHPFADGNGRTGKVLYNWLRGSLHDPVWPPDFFGGIENP